MRRPILALLAAIIATMPVAADWRAETGVFRIGVVDPGGGTTSPARYEPFREAVSTAIDMPVEVLVLRDAPSLIDAQTSGRIEYAILSALGYAAAQEMCACLVPLVVPRTAGGATGVRSVLVVDAATGEEAVGSGPIGYGPEGSLTGALAPQVAFTHQGQPLGEAGLDLVVQPSFEAARDAFLAGDLAGLFAWDYAVADPDRAIGGGLGAALVGDAAVGASILWRSEHVPFGPHAVRDTVPADVRTALREALVALEEAAPDAYDVISPTLGGGFVPVEAADYAFAARIVKALAETP
ncbi:phosphate/phosphite/phosphonate ABC transporter substrate-binding protein [Roseitalea porphyridii]|nr:PhnD/SsuA/transferrin family substrate-binding protein [Roseitalea porphyridii]